MAVSEEFRLFVEDLLAPVGQVRIKPMFGGAGIYADGVMFALIAQETLYFKADGETQADFIAAGSGPFTYGAKGRGKPVQMSYWRAPESLFDDAEEMAAWARRAIEAAKRAKR